MEYISVKEAANRFHLSERRIQKLCETKRIPGCIMLSGVWLIPSNAVKPSDERFNTLPEGTDYLTLKDICEELSISTATGRNWIKSGKLIPDTTINNVPFFKKDYLIQIKDRINSSGNNDLKSRRNKKHISGNEFYKGYIDSTSNNINVLIDLLNNIENNSYEVTKDLIRLLLADCALQLLICKSEYNSDISEPLIKQYLSNNIQLDSHSDLIDDLIGDKKKSLRICSANEALFKYCYTYNEGEDILGLMYLSCTNLGSRKNAGAYYTPTRIVKKLISKLSLKPTDKILDPCCGTGNFLIQLPSDISINCIFGNDLDEISVKLTRINMALKFKDADSQVLKSHITQKDFLTEYDLSGFHHIIGNPPWGYSFNKEEKTLLNDKYISAMGKTIESYDLFIENSLKKVSINGCVSFVIPEALLSVKAHKPIRNIIMSSNSIRYLEFISNAFDKVLCPAIILQIVHTNEPMNSEGMEVECRNHKFTIKTRRDIDSDNFCFLADDKQYDLIKKIKNKPSVCLKEHADFALGIVTGNNKEFITHSRTNHNEVILKGSDIYKYSVRESNNYVLYGPEHFQQTAPEKFYRAHEKLFYRFICNQLVFAYDDKQRLSLNSCNILIPRLPGYDTKYILAILNSSVAQFVYKMEFNSIKVLRTHIESIPIPVTDIETQKTIIKLVDKLINGLPEKETERTYKKIDRIIYDLFSLTKEEIKIIEETANRDNRFLN